MTTTMDHVLAQSLALRASHRPPQTPTSAVDDIPPLTRALHQIHSDAHRLLHHSTSTSTQQQQQHPSQHHATPSASTLRLFSTLGVDIDRLHRSVMTLDSASTFVETFHRPLPPFRQPSWLAPRAVDDARLSLNSSLRCVADDAIDKDVAAATRNVISTMVALYPRGPSDHDIGDSSNILIGSDSSSLRMGIGMGKSPNVNRRRRTSMSPHSTKTPTTASKSPSATANKSGSSNMNTPNRATTPVFSSLRRSPIPMSMSMTPSPTRTKSPHAPPPVASLPLPKPYVDAVRSIASRGHALHLAASTLHSASVIANDVAHFRIALDIVSRCCTEPVSVENEMEENFVWAARESLEDEFASRIPGMSQRPRHAEPREVVEIVELAIFNAGNGVNATELPFRVPSRPSAWVCVYVCLRCGAVAAARTLLERTSVVAARFFSMFEQGVQVVLGGNHLNVEQQDRSFSPMLPGCLTTEDMYEEVAREYRHAAMSSDDPYMRACYVLLMRLDFSTPASVAMEDEGNGIQSGVSRKGFTAGGSHERYSLYVSDEDFEAVFPNVEDYLWLHLWLCRTISELNVLDNLPRSSFLRIKDVRAEVLTCGDSHFNEDGKQPMLYAFVLCAVGLMREAVDYLYQRSEEHWLHYAVHLALALYHAEWVGFSDDENVVERMIGRYVELVSLRDVCHSVVYVYAMLQSESVNRLVREKLVKKISGGNVGVEVDALVGQVSDDGSLKRRGALLAAIITDDEDLDLREGYEGDVRLACGMTVEDVRQMGRMIAEESAVEAQRRNELGRAAELYAAAGKLELVADMRVRDATREVHQLTSRRRSSAIKALRSINMISLQEVVREIIGIGAVFEDYWTGRYAGAWERLRGCVTVVPMRQSEMAAATRLTGLISKFCDSCFGKVKVAECVVEVVKVALHVADYALESGSVVGFSNLDGDPGGGGRMGTGAGAVGGLPTIDEIKSLCAFAALLKTADATIEQRLIKMDGFVI